MSSIENVSINPLHFLGGYIWLSALTGFWTCYVLALSFLTCFLMNLGICLFWLSLSFFLSSSYFLKVNAYSPKFKSCSNLSVVYMFKGLLNWETTVYPHCSDTYDSEHKGFLVLFNNRGIWCCYELDTTFTGCWEEGSLFINREFGVNGYSDFFPERKSTEVEAIDDYYLFIVIEFIPCWDFWISCKLISLGTGYTGDIWLLLLLDTIEMSLKLPPFKFIDDVGVGSPFIDSRSIADILNKSSSIWSIALLTSLFWFVLKSENLLFYFGK